MKLRLKRRPVRRLNRLELLSIPKAKYVPQSFGPVGPFSETPQKAGPTFSSSVGFPPR
jgi:hypothetical protein